MCRGNAQPYDPLGPALQGSQVALSKRLSKRLRKRPNNR